MLFSVIVAVLLAPYAQPSVASLEVTMRLCCRLGNEWAITGVNCSGYTLATDSNLAIELRPLCLATVEICCVRQQRHLQCVAGQSAAKRGVTCKNGLTNLPERAYYRDCCEACKVGLVAASLATCAPFKLGSPWSEVMEACCAEAAVLNTSTICTGATCHHICELTGDSYNCKCHNGFTLTSDGHSCIVANVSQPICENGYAWNTTINQCADIDECIDNARCSHTTCLNTLGGFTCEPEVTSCEIGFKRHAGKCIDINECETDRDACDTNQICTNEPGGFRCDCRTGFSMDPVTNACIDINECQINIHDCHETQRCDNTIGSYSCIRLQSCGTGYTLNAGTGLCDDDDECKLGTHNCEIQYECKNTKGSFRCERLRVVIPHLLNGAICEVGYRSDDHGRCLDVNECEEGTAACATGQFCRNKPGGYVCYCPPGYVLGNKRYCEDIDECSTNSACPAHTLCVNTPGSFRCECGNGFSNNLTAGRTFCMDVDECAKPGICNQHCVNYWGSYRCTCEAGWRLSADNHTCDDLNECETRRSYELCVGGCVNTRGSYICTCPTGYRLGTDGRSCLDVDECAANVCQSNEICTNTRGSHRCYPVTCPSGYAIDTERRNRCRRISLLCDRDDLDCFARPSSYSFNFITLVANMSVPPLGRALFNLKGPNWYDNIDFFLRVVNVEAPPDIFLASDTSFTLRKMHNEALLSLVEALQGPQDVELELSMTVYKDHLPAGSNIAKIFIFVSEHTF